MLSQLSEIQTQIKDYNITVSQLTTKINELTLKIDEMTGDVVSIRKCGQSVDFVLYSDGRLLLKGIGATFDYSTDSNPSPFQNNFNIKLVIVLEVVTDIGERLFQYCDNLKTVSLPTTLAAIKSITVPSSVTTVVYTHTHWLNVRDGKNGSVDYLNTAKNLYKMCPAYVLPHWAAFKAKVQSCHTEMR